MELLTAGKQWLDYNPHSPALKAQTIHWQQAAQHNQVRHGWVRHGSLRKPYALLNNHCSQTAAQVRSDPFPRNQTIRLEQPEHSHPDEDRTLLQVPTQDRLPEAEALHFDRNVRPDMAFAPMEPTAVPALRNHQNHQEVRVLDQKRARHHQNQNSAQDDTHFAQHCYQQTRRSP
ncbi:hypothetical protein FQZ97_981810 [compost metagenome]